MKAITPAFNTRVRVTLSAAHLTCVGPLLCHPIARLRNEDGAILATTKGSPFTDHPQWAETLETTLPMGAGEGETNATHRLWIEIVDVKDGVFLGAVAKLPIPLMAASTCNELQRWMLGPRFAPGTNGRKYRGEDLALLKKYKEDDFGFVDAKWSVERLPAVPAAMLGGQLGSHVEAGVTFPVGVALRVQWLASASFTTSSSLSGGQLAVTASFGFSQQTYRVDGTKPLHVALGSPQDARLRFAFWANAPGGDDLSNPIASGAREVGEVVFQLALNRINTESIGCFPVAPSGTMALGAGGQNLQAHASLSPAEPGIAIISTFVTQQPLSGTQQLCDLRTCPMINDPVHNRTAGHQYADWGREAPDVAPGPCHPIVWESHEHINRAIERRHRRSVVGEAKAQPEHLRHLFDVIRKRCDMAQSMLSVVTNFYNIQQTTQVACDLRQLLIAMAFACTALDTTEAAAFAFEVIVQGRSMQVQSQAIEQREESITSEDLIFLFESCLLPRTLDLPAREVQRRAMDMYTGLGAEPITRSTFYNRVAKHYGFWFYCGAALEGAPAASSDRGINFIHATDDTHDPTQWRHFIIRIVKSGKGFAVTAHRNDTFARVSRMIEQSVGINHAKQRLTYEQSVVDGASLVGQLVPQGNKPSVEIGVAELDDTVTLTLICREKNRKWEHKISLNEKVLRLRAHVQQITMIPLSRIELTFGGKAISDRHTIGHYGVLEGSPIEIINLV